MDFIYRTSNYFAKKLALKVPNDKFPTIEDQIEVYTYGIQFFVGGFIKIFLLMIIAFILGIVVESLIVALTFASFRVIGGGWHMKSYVSCAIVSLTTFLGTALIAHNIYNYLHTTNLSYLISFCVVSGAYVIYKYVPKDTPNKPINTQEQIKKFKKWSLVYLIIWTLVMSLLVLLNIKIIVLASCLGILLEYSFIIPFTCWFYQKLDNISI